LEKFLRIDVNGPLPFAIPMDNPFSSEIWAYGLRNPWHFSFDHFTGDLFIADVGESNREELNFQAAGGAGGESYGWRLMEGTACFNPAQECNDGSLTLPIVEYDHSQRDCSITGGYRYRGTLFSGLQGIYLYGDLCTGKIWGAMQTAGGCDSEVI
jgi:glucose/arabinose dehydrogenase